ncbi:MAG: hypothetical protein ACJ8R9_12760 [Steroidobacteraceae bacterium]
MSDNYLQLIPTDPQIQPSVQTAEHARSLLEKFTPDAETVVASFKESVEFFNSGSNGSEIRCPACGAEASYWWLSAMDEAWKSRFNQLEVTAHCCKASVCLNELRYDWPAGFARFVLEARNPNIPDLSYEQLAQLESVLGCSLRRIWLRR